MKIEVKMNKPFSSIPTSLNAAASVWINRLNRTKPINPVNNNYEWVIPTAALLYLEQSAPNVPIDYDGDYEIYALFSNHIVDKIADSDERGVTYLATLNGNLCIWSSAEVGWVQLRSIVSSEHSSSVMSKLYDIRERIIAINDVSRHPDTMSDMILKLSDITDTLDDRQIKTNGFAACFVDILKVLDSIQVSGSVDIPLVDSYCKPVEGKCIQAEVLRSEKSDVAMVTIDLPAGVGLFMSKDSVDFNVQVLEKHPVTGCIASRTMQHWSGQIGALWFNCRRPTTVTLTLKV